MLIAVFTMSAAQFMASPSWTDVSSTGVLLVVVMIGRSFVTTWPVGSTLRPAGRVVAQNPLGAAVNENICTLCFPVWG